MEVTQEFYNDTYFGEPIEDEKLFKRLEARSWDMVQMYLGFDVRLIEPRLSDRQRFDLIIGVSAQMEFFFTHGLVESLTEQSTLHMASERIGDTSYSLRAVNRGMMTTGINGIPISGLLVSKIDSSGVYSQNNTF